MKTLALLLLLAASTLAQTVDVTCSWTAPADNEGWPCREYRGWINDNRIANLPWPWVPGSVQSYTFSDLPPGSYVFSLVGVDHRWLVSDTAYAAFTIACADTVEVSPWDCGDVNRDSTTNIQDITHLINIVFRGGVCP